MMLHIAPLQEPVDGSVFGPGVTSHLGGWSYGALFFPRLTQVQTFFSNMQMHTIQMSGCS
jgi:hypothetical protein